jgi:hypothetical protein
MTWSSEAGEYILHEIPRENEVAVYPVHIKNGIREEKRYTNPPRLDERSGGAYKEWHKRRKKMASWT